MKTKIKWKIKQKFQKVSKAQAKHRKSLIMFNINLFVAGDAVLQFKFDLCWA